MSISLKEWVYILLSGVLSGVLCLLLQSEQVDAQPTVKYEYLYVSNQDEQSVKITFPLDAVDTKLINYYGDQGWHIIDVNDQGDTVYYLFERVK